VTTTPRRSLRAAPLALLAAVVAALMVVAGGSPATAGDRPGGGSPGEHRTGHDRPGDYLALGDSVPFGYSPRLLIGGDAARYVGYPDLAARRLGLRLTNLSCPGEASDGFVRAGGADNGCRTFRAVAPLHAAYRGTQLDAAQAFLAKHPRTRLVTLMLGANDLFICQDGTADRCSSPAELAAVLHTYEANLDKVLEAVRSEYDGRLVLVTYYSTDYTDDRVTGSVRALNRVIETEAARHGARTADGFAAFKAASAGSGGRPCAAGLLIRLSNGGCDVHPSPAGAQVLAGAVRG
jgi:lysophospholipase L1-like esterase